MTADLQGDEATLLALYEKAFANESTGFTLLHTAAGKGHDRVVELLLQRGTEVDLQDNTGCTARSGSPPTSATRVWSSLVQHGAEVNLEDIDGITALKASVMRGHDHRHAAKKEATSNATSLSCNVYYKREQIRRRALRAV